MKYSLIYFYFIHILFKERSKIYIMGIGDWGLGIGDWGLGPIPNPQSPIPNPQSPLNQLKIILYNINYNLKNKLIIF